jgi:hypothetical protein
MQAETAQALALEHESAQTVRYLYNQARGAALRGAAAAL